MTLTGALESPPATWGISMPALPTVLVAGATMVAPVPNTDPIDLNIVTASSASVVAQDAEPRIPENTIIITARRRQEAAQDVPIAIGVLDGRTINDTGAFSVYKIQQLTPTLQIYSSNPRNTAVNIRGIGVPFGLTNDGFEQGVGIYVDDVYYSRPASAVFDFLDVAQVEVLRGPQGTLYGKNTTAGAINIRTNQPTFHTEGSAELSVGNYNFVQGKAAISGPLSSTVAVRLAVSGTTRRGTIFNVTSGDWIQSQDNKGARAQILFRPQRNLNVTLTGDYSTQDPVCCGTRFVWLARPSARQPAVSGARGGAWLRPGKQRSVRPADRPGRGAERQEQDRRRVASRGL